MYGVFNLYISYCYLFHFFRYDHYSGHISQCGKYNNSQRDFESLSLNSQKPLVILYESYKVISFVVHKSGR